MTREAARGRDVAFVLTEARTVYRRARTAINKIEDGRELHPDPDTDEILADLEKVVEVLSRWRRTGR